MHCQSIPARNLSTLRLRSGLFRTPSTPLRKWLFVTVTLFVPVLLFSQGGAIIWNKSGNGYYRFEEGELGLYTLPQHTKTVIITKKQLTPEGKTAPISG